MNRFTVVSACALVAAASAFGAVAQDLAKVNPKHVKVLLDNDEVRVLELSIPPGESTGMHSHGKNLVYFVTGGSAKQTLPDGKSTQMTRSPGEALWSEPVTHDTTNIGKAPVKAVVVELKK